MPNPVIVIIGALPAEMMRLSLEGKPDQYHYFVPLKLDEPSDIHVCLNFERMDLLPDQHSPLCPAAQETRIYMFRMGFWNNGCRVRDQNNDLWHHRHFRMLERMDPLKNLLMIEFVNPPLRFDISGGWTPCTEPNTKQGQFFCCSFKFADDWRTFNEVNSAHDGLVRPE